MELLGRHLFLRAAGRNPPEFDLPSSAYLKVTEDDLVESLLQVDLALHVASAVLAAVVHHQLPVNVKEGAIVGVGGEDIAAGSGGVEPALPLDAEGRMQQVIGGDEGVNLDDGWLASPVPGAWVVLAQEAEARELLGVQGILWDDFLLAPRGDPAQLQPASLPLLDTAHGDGVEARRHELGRPGPAAFAFHQHLIVNG